MSKKTKKSSVWINGFSGRMGQALEKLLYLDESFDVIGGAGKEDFSEKVLELKKADFVIDFSSKEGTSSLLSYIEKNEAGPKSYLICTTGLSEESQNAWKRFGEKPGSKVMLAPNTSLGVLLTLKAALEIGPVAKNEGFDCLIEETHHRYKKDAPSGTALFLGKSLAKKTSLNLVTENDDSDPSKSIKVHAMRGGGVFGEHTIRFISDHEEIALTHRAFSRDLFAKGALFLAKWLLLQNPGFYDLERFSSR